MWTLVEIVFIILLLSGGFWACRLIFPLIINNLNAPQFKPGDVEVHPKQNSIVTPPASQADSTEERYHKIELLLNEKNQIISKLEVQLKNATDHREEFEKIKALLEEQIIELRGRNRNLKLELGIKERFNLQELIN